MSMQFATGANHESLSLGFVGPKGCRDGLEIEPTEWTITEWQRASWQTSEDKGWHAEREIDGIVRNASTGERIALVHTELSEALEEARKGTRPTEVYFSDGGKPEGFPIELADAVIRILDLAEENGVNLQAALMMKAEYNRGRSFRHGGKVLG